MFHYFKGMAGSEKRERSGRPGAKGVELFKGGKYEEAINEFTKFLKTMPDDENKKVAHYNRGMSYYNLGQHDSALQDGEECLKIDPFWAKGYKCKGLALEEMGRPRDAVETFLDGQKVCIGHDQNTEAVLRELIKRLNRVTGFLGEDLDLRDRMRKEKYCVSCNLFEKDIGRSHEPHDGKKFLSCDRCKMVNYCCPPHRNKDKATHNKVCDELLMIRKNSEDDYEEEDALALIVLKPKGPKGQEMVDTAKRLMDSLPEMKNIMDYLRGVGDGNLMPLYQLNIVKPVTKTQQKELNTWNDLFAMIEPEMMTTDVKRALTRVLTDPVTVFYAMKQISLLDNGDEDKAIRLHVVGAEPSKEISKIKVFFHVLSNITGRKLHIVFIGPLLVFLPEGQVEIVNPEITFFRGTYQDYILTSDYEEPDCILAFFPGLYDGTYNWLPAVAQAIARKVPFIVTCNSKEDHQKTKDWLMKGTHMMKPEIVQDYLNPFDSWEAVQDISGSNKVSKRNMFSLLFMGGDLGVVRPLLRLEDEKVELVQVLFRSQGKCSLSDILELKKSGKM